MSEKQPIKPPAPQKPINNPNTEKRGDGSTAPTFVTPQRPPKK